MKQTTYTTAKKTKRAVRVWIEGQKLTQCGFVPGAAYTFAAEDKKLTLKLDKKGKRKVTKSSKGGKDRPIIDLHSKMVANTFKAGQKICLTFTKGMILVEHHHKDKKQSAREKRIKSNIKKADL